MAARKKTAGKKAVANKNTASGKKKWAAAVTKESSLGSERGKKKGAKMENDELALDLGMLESDAADGHMAFENDDEAAAGAEETAHAQVISDVAGKKGAKAGSKAKKNAKTGKRGLKAAAIPEIEIPEEKIAPVPNDDEGEDGDEEGGESPAEEDEDGDMEMRAKAGIGSKAGKARALGASAAEAVSETMSIAADGSAAAGENANALGGEDPVSTSIQPVQTREHLLVQSNLSAQNPEKVLEAALFMSSQPIASGDLAKLVGIAAVGFVDEKLSALSKKYEETASAIEIVKEENGKWSMRVRAGYAGAVRQFAGEAEISRHALKTLAYISKNEGIKKRDLFNRLGSLIYENVAELMEKGFVSATPAGRTVSLKTTAKFRKYFEG